MPKDRELLLDSDAMPCQAEFLLRLVRKDEAKAVSDHMRPASATALCQKRGKFNPSLVLATKLMCISDVHAGLSSYVGQFPETEMLQSLVEVSICTDEHFEDVV